MIRLYTRLLSARGRGVVRVISCCSNLGALLLSFVRPICRRSVRSTKKAEAKGGCRSDKKGLRLIPLTARASRRKFLNAR